MEKKAWQLAPILKSAVDNACLFYMCVIVWQWYRSICNLDKRLNSQTASKEEKVRPLGQDTSC